YGFESVELFATRTHFDYHSQTAVADLQQWLADAGLTLHGIHAPVNESFIGGRWGKPLTLASIDPDERAHAVAEAERALHVARRIPAAVLVAHLGVPRSQSSAPQDNNREAARRSIEELQRLAAPLDVRIAVEVIPNELSRTGSLVYFVEEELEAPGVGICLDFGHAHLEGDLLDAIQTASGHLITTLVYANRGCSDAHLLRFVGTVAAAAARTVMQKIGYDQSLLFEAAAHGSTKDPLTRARKARERLERMLAE